MINPLNFAVFGLLAVSTSVLATEAAKDAAAAPAAKDAAAAPAAKDTAAAPADGPHGYGGGRGNDYGRHGYGNNGYGGGRGNDWDRGRGNDWDILGDILSDLGRGDRGRGGYGYKAKRDNSAVEATKAEAGKADWPYGYGNDNNYNRPNNYNPNNYNGGGRGQYDNYNNGYNGDRRGGYGYKAKRDNSAVEATKAEAGKADWPYGYGNDNNYNRPNNYNPNNYNGGGRGQYDNYNNGYNGDRRGGYGYKAKRDNSAVEATKAEAGKADWPYGYGNNNNNYNRPNNYNPNNYNGGYNGGGRGQYDHYNNGYNGGHRGGY